MHTDVTVDHLVVAGRDLDELVDAFTDAGLKPEYGGEHGNGITHNYILGFPDHSYIELISTIKPGVTSPWWDDEIRRTSGPAAWALSVTDIKRETERLADRGLTVDGPSYYSRTRPDGHLIEWDLTIVGDQMGVPFPFLIEDRTPPERRAPVAPSVRATSLLGITNVLLAVNDLNQWLEPFSDLFACDIPDQVIVDELDAVAASFPNAPITLFAPRGSGYLLRRVRRFENRPFGCVFSVADTDAYSTLIDWSGDNVQWLSIAAPGRFGVINQS